MKNSLEPYEITGGCLCRNIRYRITEHPLMCAICYCRQCQHSSGSEATQVLVVPRTQFKVIKGEPKKYKSKGGSGFSVIRCFCGECGSPLFALPEGNRDLVSVKICSLDDPAAFKPNVAIFIREAQPWTSTPEKIHLFQQSLQIP